MRKPLVLDLEGGAGPTTYHQGFESGGLGDFLPQNNDAGIPGTSDEEGLAKADGWRCPYDDPDWPHSNSYGSPNAENCDPGVTLAQANATFWQVDGVTVSASPDGGPAHTGNHSMYYGIFLAPSLGLTTPLSTVEAAGSDDPIYLGSGEPTLSFYHQVSWTTGPCQSPPLRSADRGVVQLQLALESDEPTADWLTLAPFRDRRGTGCPCRR